LILSLVDVGLPTTSNNNLFLLALVTQVDCPVSSPMKRDRGKPTNIEKKYQKGCHSKVILEHFIFDQAQWCCVI